jgi:hypothetical protein
MKLLETLHYKITGYIFQAVAFINKIRYNTPDNAATLDIEDLRHLNADEPIAKFFTGKQNGEVDQ